jgi:hypothetical protein
MLFGYLTRGLAAGLVAGLVFGLFMALVGNPLLGLAEASAGAGHAHAAAGTDAANPGLVSATVTRLVAIVSGILWGLLLGLAFGLALFLLEPVLPDSPAVASAVLAGAGFLTASGAPWLVLPPQPPGVAYAVGTDTRLLVYGGMMLVGGIVALLSILASHRVQANGPGAAVLAGLAPLALLAIPVWFAPSMGVEPVLAPALRATVRGAIVFGQVAIWTTLAATHAWLWTRSAAASTADHSLAEDLSPAD